MHPGKSYERGNQGGKHNVRKVKQRWLCATGNLPASDNSPLPPGEGQGEGDRRMAGVLGLPPYYSARPMMHPRRTHGLRNFDRRRSPEDAKGRRQSPYAPYDSASEPIPITVVAATPGDTSSARSEEEAMPAKSIGDDERRRDATYIGASLWVAAAVGRLHRRPSRASGSNDSSSTYLLVIRHRRRSLHTARRRSQSRLVGAHEGY